MTEREQKYIDDCHAFLRAVISTEGDAGVKAICVNALSKHIREVLDMWVEPVVSRSDQSTVLIGLTFADLIQLQNGGTIQVPAPEEGERLTAIWIFLGGTEEHMRKGADKHPGADFRFFDSHGDKRN